MKKLPQRFLWLFYGLILLTASGFGVRAWLASRQAAVPVLVEWKTASELNTAGFNLYRSEAPGGSLTQVNTSLIPAAPDPLTGGSYQFKDPNALPGRTYYYMLEEVENGGGTNRYGPIEVQAKGSGQLDLWASLGLGLVALAGFIMLALPLRKSRLPLDPDPVPPGSPGDAQAATGAPGVDDALDG